MKNKLSWVAVISLCLVLLYGCSAPVNNVSADNFDFDISEEQFAETVNDILGDFSSHAGQTIRLEGIFEYFGEDTVYRYVFRRLGC